MCTRNICWVLTFLPRLAIITITVSPDRYPHPYNPLQLVDINHLSNRKQNSLLVSPAWKSICFILLPSRSELTFKYTHLSHWKLFMRFPKWCWRIQHTLKIEFHTVKLTHLFPPIKAQSSGLKVQENSCKKTLHSGSEAVKLSWLKGVMFTNSCGKRWKKVVAKMTV